MHIYIYIICILHYLLYSRVRSQLTGPPSKDDHDHLDDDGAQTDTPNLPTQIVPTNIVRVKLYGEFPMDMGIPPL